MSLAFLFDAIEKADENNNKYFRERELKNDISRLKSECGSCTKWMHSSVCNRERTRMVTCGDRICSDFEMDSYTQKLIAAKEQELSDLNK